MSPERNQIDTDAIKRSVNLAEFAQRYTTLKQISQRREGEYAGACPLCGGEDRFHVKGDHFYCRQCYPRGGDVINLVQLLHQVSFLDACQMLMAGPFFFSEKQDLRSSQTDADSEERSDDWQSAAYQESAFKTILATHGLLLSREGAVGQKYLLSRGLDEETWRTYQLGFGRTIRPLLRGNEEAIFIPWFSGDGKTISAIQHRFIDPALEKGQRYTLKPGSEPILFGLQALQPAACLFVVEGEFNCMSLHQADAQALSVGSQSNIGNIQARLLLRQYMPDYERVIVWFDNPDYGKWVAGWLAEEGLFRKENVRSVAHEMDANELLVAGGLEDFVSLL